SDDESSGNPMVSGFQEELDLDDLDISTTVPIEQLSEPEDATDGKSSDGNDFSRKSSENKLEKSLKKKRIPKDFSLSFETSQLEVNDSSEPLDDINEFLVDNDDEQSSSLDSKITAEKNRTVVESDNLDDWLNTDENTIANPYVSNTSDMPEEAPSDNSDDDNSIT
ncbi:unnamed protein product, partial [Meganyctiphanes norvegica]